MARNWTKEFDQLKVQIDRVEPLRTVDAEKEKRQLWYELETLKIDINNEQPPVAKVRV
jgi:hypothetical protein